MHALVLVVLLLIVLIAALYYSGVITLPELKEKHTSKPFHRHWTDLRCLQKCGDNFGRCYRGCMTRNCYKDCSDSADYPQVCMRNCDRDYGYQVISQPSSELVNTFDRSEKPTSPDYWRPVPPGL